MFEKVKPLFEGVKPLFEAFHVVFFLHPGGEGSCISVLRVMSRCTFVVMLGIR